MRRAVLACLSILAVAAPAAGAAMSQPSRTALDGFVCQRASNALDRVIAVVGVMRPMSGTQRMEMKFLLQRKASGADTFSAVRGGDLGRWLTPNPATLGQHSTDVWRLRKLVANLPGPATYRFRVVFRWMGDTSVVLGHSTLTSANCWQPQ